MSESLYNFQKALLDLLNEDLEPSQIMQRLQSDSQFESFRDYTKDFDLDMIAVAAELAKKWGQQTDSF
ncbi:MAG: hypothetical protein K2X29_11985 [Candidatus Obscuribacterales bacterium]|nr:hypothetical protein [Candidatus Obscuribacterales bacterium]